MRVTGLAVVLIVGLFAAPFAIEAQQTRKIPRVGVLGGQSPNDSPAPPILALRQGLRELGYVEGQNIAIEWRWAHGKLERFPDLAAELVKLEVDIIVAATLPGVEAAQKATRTIPIVMGFVSDPVAYGLVASLARPGGNVTGLSGISLETAGKQLALLKEMVPKDSEMSQGPYASTMQDTLSTALVGGQGLGLARNLVDNQAERLGSHPLLSPDLG